MVARAQLLRFVVSLINLNDSVSFLEIRESKSKDGNQILCHSQVFCFKTTSIHWTGNTDTPTERTGAVIIGVIIECVTKKALSLTTDQDSHWNRILLIAFAGTVSQIDYVTITNIVVSWLISSIYNQEIGLASILKRNYCEFSSSDFTCYII